LNRLATRLALATAIACVSLASHAQVFKCGQGAAAVFTDKPCEAGAQRVPLQVRSAADASVDFEILTRHYQVTAPNYRAAIKALHANSNEFTAWARWKVDYKFDTKPVDAGCTLSALRLKVIGDILMPSWSDEGGASPADQAAWRNMYAILKRHEDGHTQNGREFALLLKERLMGMGVLPCAALQSRVEQEYRRLYANLRDRDNEYDRRTDHGRRQDNPQ
jgi:predicted secreted Zn-dependent protease